MPFPYTLPTTSTISYPTYFESSLYPTLPLAASSHRGSLRNALKAHKRLSPAAQASNIPFIIKQLENYVAYLLSLCDTLETGDSVFKEDAPRLLTSWRAVLSTKRVTVKEPARVVRPGLSYEIFWTISSLGYAYTLLARSQLQGVLSPPANTSIYSNSTADPAAAASNSFAQAINNLITSTSIFTHLLTHQLPPHATSWPPDLSPQVISALSSLSLADATLTAVIKQDPYPTYLTLTTATSEKKQKSKEWLYSPPPPPSSVRSLLLARLCIAASDHAAKAFGLLSTAQKTDAGEISEELLRYADSLQKVSRAKSCRFLGVDAEAAGRVGEGISWVRAAKIILNSASPPSASFVGEKLRRKEDVWGADAGRADEGKTLEELEVRWKKLNDSVMFQSCPNVGELMGRIPTGREFHDKVKEWKPPKLGADELRALKTGDVGTGAVVEEEDSDEEETKDDGGSYAGKGGYY